MLIKQMLPNQSHQLLAATRPQGFSVQAVGQGRVSTWLTAYCYCTTPTDSMTSSHLPQSEFCFLRRQVLENNTLPSPRRSPGPHSASRPRPTQIAPRRWGRRPRPPPDRRTAGSRAAAAAAPTGLRRREGKGPSARPAAAYLSEHFLQLALGERHGGGGRPPPPQHRQRRAPASARLWRHFRAGTAPPGGTARCGQRSPLEAGRSANCSGHSWRNGTQTPRWRFFSIARVWCVTTSPQLLKRACSIWWLNPLTRIPKMNRTPGLLTMGQPPEEKKYTDQHKSGPSMRHLFNGVFKAHSCSHHRFCPTRKETSAFTENPPEWHDYKCSSYFYQYKVLVYAALALVEASGRQKGTIFGSDVYSTGALEVPLLFQQP